MNFGFSTPNSSTVEVLLQDVGGHEWTTEKVMYLIHLQLCRDTRPHKHIQSVEDLEDNVLVRVIVSIHI